LAAHHAIFHPVEVFFMSKVYADQLRFQQPSSRRLAKRVGGLLLALGTLTSLLVGCSGGEGTVSGKVLLRGNPLPGGRVTFRPADSQQNPVSAVIDANGNFELTAPVGPGVFTVDNRELKKAPPPEKPIIPGFKTTEKHTTTESPHETASKMPGSYIEIPSKYYSTDTSDLKYTVQKGAQTYNLELK
jgi:hypothetical protein